MINSLRAKTLTATSATVAHRPKNSERKNPSFTKTSKQDSPQRSTRSGRKVKQANYDMKHHPMDTVVKPRTAAKRAAARDHKLGLNQSVKVKSSRAGYESLQGSPATPVRKFKNHQQFPESKKQLSSHDTDTRDHHQIDSSASPVALKEDLGNSTALEKNKKLTWQQL